MGRRRGRLAAPQAQSVSRAIALALYEAGIREAFGLLGGGIAPFAAGLASTPIPLPSLSSRGGRRLRGHRGPLRQRAPGPRRRHHRTRPVQRAQRRDGGGGSTAPKLLVISGFTSRAQAGRGAVQETSIHTMPTDVTRPGSIFHEVALPESEEELAHALGRIRRGFAGPGGFVAHLGLSLALQTRMLSRPLSAVSAAAWSIDPPAPTTEALDTCLAALVDPSAAIWIGHGARGASAALRRFAELAALPVISSPRAKGSFPSRTRCSSGSAAPAAIRPCRSGSSAIGPPTC